MKPFLNIIIFIFLCCVCASSQGIRGDTIFLEVNKTVTIVFLSSPGKAQLVPDPAGPDGEYEINSMDKFSISILLVKKGTRDQYLEISEKDRNHLFVLAYKAGSAARKITFSKRRLISQRIEATKNNLSLALTKADSLFEEAKKKPSLSALKDVENRYLRLSKVVYEVDSSYVTAQLSDVRKQLVDLDGLTYGKTFKEGQDHFNSKKYKEASESFSKAISFKPGDPEASKYLNETNTAWAREHIDLGDEARKNKKNILAKNYYQQALNIQPDYPSVRDKFAEAKRLADPEIYAIQRDKGEIAFGEWRLKDARLAYDSALMAKPEDAFAKGRRLKVIIEEEKIAKEDQRDDDYQDILERAKNLTEKASGIQDVDQVIQEYQKAAQMYPLRQFPVKSISELKKLKLALAKSK